MRYVTHSVGWVHAINCPILYVHTYLPTYLPPFLPSYPMMHPTPQATVGLVIWSGLCWFLKEQYFLHYKPLGSLVTAPCMLPVTFAPGLPTVQLLETPFSPNTESIQWLKIHSLWSPPQEGSDRSSFTSYFTFLKGLGHLKYFMIYN